jgi:NAD(P)-dependent dehydrogenase (short-subunit alcohol dehydrogenase family)
MTRNPLRILVTGAGGLLGSELSGALAERGYSGTRAYCQSKLAQIMFTIDLAAALEGTGVTVTCLHPATYMDTTMVRRAGVTPLSTVEEGAQAVVNLAASPAVEGGQGSISTASAREKRRPKLTMLMRVGASGR